MNTYVTLKTLFTGLMCVSQWQSYEWIKQDKLTYKYKLLKRLIYRITILETVSHLYG